MAILRSLKKIIKNPNFNFTSITKTQPLSRNPLLSSDAVLSFPSLHGPLFLSSPPWMLSLFATPLLVRSDVVLPRSLRLIQHPQLGFPFKLGMIINEWYLPAFAGLAISGATDWLDGFLARRMGINSVVGSYLDPLADKVLVGSVALAMVEKSLLHPGLVGLVVLRDVMLVGGAVYKRGSSLRWQWKSWYDFFNLDGTLPEKVEPLFISKVNTVFQLLLVAAALLQPELGTPQTQTYITYLSWLVACTTVGSTAAYGVQHMRNKPISIARGC